VEVGLCESGTPSLPYIQCLVAVETMQYTCRSELGLIEHSDIRSYIRDHPLEVLLLPYIVHAPDIPQANCNCSPSLLFGGCVVVVLFGGSGVVIHCVPRLLCLYSTVHVHVLSYGGNDKLVEGVLSEVLAVEEAVLVLAVSINLL